MKQINCNNAFVMPKWVVAASFTLCLLLCSGSYTAGQASLPQASAPACEPSRQRQLALNVEDKEGHFANLRLEDLALTIDKAPAEILNLEAKLDQPLAVVILIDTSMSQEFTLSQTKLAAQKFVEWVLRTKRDRAAVVSFSGEAIVEEELTNESARLQAAIARIESIRPPDYVLGGVGAGRSPPIRPQRQGSTAIWNAVWSSTDGILKPITGVRRIVMLLTDGLDNSSTIKLREAVEYAALHDVAVFSISTLDKGYTIYGRDEITELSEDTGGRSFVMKKVQDIPQILQRTERELRSHYLLTYCAPGGKPAGVVPRLRIDLKNPQLRTAKLRLSYRRYAVM
ncbi:MAG: hypothetical protein QOE77_1892 [Blastocatellia bacterium]|jgi:VWFA-related protein|nr:hypothetical protein [Blastocatellia bacterium]